MKQRIMEETNLEGKTKKRWGQGILQGMWISSYFEPIVQRESST